MAVMKHNGVAVYVPPEQRPAGMASIACGALDHARRLARRNVAVLAEAVRQGYHVVATEPAAALCLVHEYPQLMDDDDARLVAAHASEACTFLWKMHTLGTTAARPAAHQRGPRLSSPLPSQGPRRRLPRRQPAEPDPRAAGAPHRGGCSGMAGTFGLLHKNYRSSLRAGWGLISRLRDTALQAGVTECSACKIQMEQGTTKPTLHPIKLLALSYGLMPELAALLTTPGEELLVV